jgi:hypothetical protein
VPRGLCCDAGDRPRHGRGACGGRHHHPA